VYENKGPHDIVSATKSVFLHKIAAFLAVFGVYVRVLGDIQPDSVTKRRNSSDAEPKNGQGIHPHRQDGASVWSGVFRTDSHEYPRAAAVDDYHGLTIGLSGKGGAEVSHRHAAQGSVGNLDVGETGGALVEDHLDLHHLPGVRVCKNDPSNYKNTS
jgi:hypothetical protein